MLGYFLFYFSTGLTVCYSFRFFYYSLCGDLNLTTFYNTGDESKSLWFGMLTLLKMVILGGSLMRWIIFPTPSIMCLSIYLKMNIVKNFDAYLLIALIPIWKANNDWGNRRSDQTSLYSVWMIVYRCLSKWTWAQQSVDRPLFWRPEILIYVALLRFVLIFCFPVLHDQTRPMIRIHKQWAKFCIFSI